MALGCIRPHVGQVQWSLVTKILRACVSRFSANEDLPLHVDLNPGQDGQGKLNMIQARKGGIFCMENAQQNQFEATRLQRVSEVIVQVAKEVLHSILQKLRRHLPSHVDPDVLQKHVLAIAINLNSALMKLEYWVNHSTVRVATPPSCPKWINSKAQQPFERSQNRLSQRHPNPSWQWTPDTLLHWDHGKTQINRMDVHVRLLASFLLNFKLLPDFTRRMLGALCFVSPRKRTQILAETCWNIDPPYPRL